MNETRAPSVAFLSPSQSAARCHVVPYFRATTRDNVVLVFLRAAVGGGGGVPVNDVGGGGVKGGGVVGVGGVVTTVVGGVGGDAIRPNPYPTAKPMKNIKAAVSATIIIIMRPMKIRNKFQKRPTFIRDQMALQGGRQS